MLCFISPYNISTNMKLSQDEDDDDDDDDEE